MAASKSFSPPVRTENRSSEISKRSNEIGEGIVKKIIKLDPELIKPNPQQPRKYFDDNELASLANDIKEHGQLQPIVVADVEGEYILIAGERRLRACKLSGIFVDAVVKKENKDIFTDDNGTALRQAIMENIKRGDLKPLETAEALKKLHETSMYFKMSKKEFSEAIGMPYTTLNRILSVVNLCDTVKSELEQGGLNVPLVTLEEISRLSDVLQIEALKRIVAEGLSVKDSVELVREAKGGGGKKESAPSRKVWCGQIKETKNKATITLDLKKIEPNLYQQILGLIESGTPN